MEYIVMPNPAISNETKSGLYKLSEDSLFTYKHVAQIRNKAVDAINNADRQTIGNVKIEAYEAIEELNEPVMPLTVMFNTIAFGFALHNYAKNYLDDNACEVDKKLLPWLEYLPLVPSLPYLSLLYTNTWSLKRTVRHCDKEIERANNNRIAQTRQI